MNCRLVPYSSEWDSSIRNFTLDEAQMGFTFLPSKAIDTAGENCFPVVILLENEPVGFFILHRSQEITQNFTQNDNAIFLRAFSIDRQHQGNGYAKFAMNQLPTYVQRLFPEIDEIILTVNEDNLSARRLYEKSGFLYIGKNKIGRIGLELGMHFSINL
jgi:RimJ/RimL family protein N-acetyltransferase